MMMMIIIPINEVVEALENIFNLDVYPIAMMCDELGADIHQTELIDEAM